ncbi:MAG: methyltransferase domain-containing protein [Nitrososphaeria archaeon]|nr:methyltransferase domain-containing protein [Nitrososphaeria archaeon]NDB87835.1 methyltransferase domain-containing protein [Nitrososphaerota archaeon]NDF26249.1 methyltransferase domain-containing protein [Nitrosopumilaceae archaeon]NDB46256.1 methyltransferase domain-containing protein [Nitrososphaeria archaeon]NDB89754.1 methyltransferase domain-containing protein [Nitrososphaerota archaeon]
MPESFFLVSKEYPELAVDEVVTLVKMYDRFAKIKTISNLVLIQSVTPWEKIARRATFVKTAGQLLRKMSNVFFDENNYSLLFGAKTFMCKAINLSEKEVNIPDIERSLGSMVSTFCNAKVSLDEPDVIIYMIFTDEENFFGFSTKFEPVKRPEKITKFHHELDWKLTRAMINLARINDDEIVCDPFCGTGSTLLEAQSMGINAIGIDFDEKMCKISKDNLKANKFSAEIYNQTYEYMDQIKFDGIVTDLPYGTASKVSEPPKKIMKKFISKIPRKAKFAIMCKKGLEDDIKLNLTKKYEIYRHKSLTRMILVK